MEKNYLLCIEYDGSRYSGWQRQGNTENTIETRISECLKLMCQGADIELHGSGRTDAGVHALGQMANVKLDTTLSIDEIKCYLNRYLPADIRILWIREVDDRFHARLNAVSKTYVYTIDNGDKADVFRRKYSWHIQEKLDIDKMNQVVEMLIGTRDFRSFSDMKTKKSSVRTINNIVINQDKNIISIEYSGDGFLYHMVRKLTAALVEVGTGRLDAEKVHEILEIKDKQVFKLLAPASGLCLKSVSYKEQ